MVRGGAQAFEAEPYRGALIADQVAPAAGAALVPFVVASKRDRPCARDEHDPASGRVAGVEGGDPVVRHFDAHGGTDELREDRPSLLAIGRAIAAGAREDDRLRHRAPE